jgi:hypothetical protein
MAEGSAAQLGCNRSQDSLESGAFTDLEVPFRDDERAASMAASIWPD